MTIQRIYVSILSALALIGCSASNETSKLALINGQPLTSDTFPGAVILLNEVAKTYCTGVFINETTVLTAAHCMENDPADKDGNVQGVQSILENVQAAENPVDDIKTVVAQSTAIIRHPLWVPGAAEGLNDVALITFPPGIAKGVNPLSTVVGKNDDAVVVVGAGRSIESERPSGFTRRQGFANLSTKVGDFKYFYRFFGALTQDNSNGSKPALAGGDSGGPLYIDGQLIGICVSHSIQNIPSSHGTEKTRVSKCINLNSPKVKTFLENHVEGPWAEPLPKTDAAAASTH